MELISSIHKEFLEGIRKHQFLFIMMCLLCLAIVPPVILKYNISEVVSIQLLNLTEETVFEMSAISQIYGIRTYFDGTSSIGLFVIIFALSGVLSKELYENTLIIPITSGKRYNVLLYSKLLILGVSLLLCSIVGSIVSYYFTGLLFDFRMSPILVIQGGMLQGLYLVYVLSMLILIGVYIKKPHIVGFVALIPAFLTAPFGRLLKINLFLPSNLIQQARMLTVIDFKEVLLSVNSTLIIIILVIKLAHIGLCKIEL